MWIIGAQMSDTPDGILPVTNENNQIIMEDRVKDPFSLKSIWGVLWDADWLSSRNRSIYQANIDGSPPYSDAKDRLRGRFGRSNVNWNLAGQSQLSAELPYNDILDSLDVFGSVSTKYGLDQERRIWNPIISEEFTRMIKNWEDFYPLWQQNVHLFTMDGVSFCTHEDDIDWRWNVVGMQYLKFYRQTKANVEELDIVVTKREIQPHKLMEKIRNREEAKVMGWDCDEVEKVVKKASSKSFPADDPQKAQSMWKNNDLYASSTSRTCSVLIAWIKELDGSVSMAWGDFDAGEDSKWMYSNRSKFKSMSSSIHAYLYGVGTNGDFHSIRGNGQKVFASTRALEMLMNKAVDMGVHASTPVIQAGSEDDIAENAIRPFGPYALITSGMTFQEIKVPNFDQSLGSSIGMLQGVFQEQASGFSKAGQAMDRTERTKYEVQARLETASNLSNGGFNLFFSAWKRHLMEVLRRVCREDYQQCDPGGREVFEFRRRCLARGVPCEAIYAVDVGEFDVNMGIGKGSAAERRIVADALKQQIYGAADPEGKRIIDNMIAAAYTNATTAKAIIPMNDDLRQPLDFQVAVLENAMLDMGSTVPVLPSQDHYVHAQTHLDNIVELSQQLTDDPNSMNQVVPIMNGPWMHGQEHLAYLDPQDERTAQLREGYQQFGEVITNGMKHIAREAEKAQAQGMQNQEAEISGAELSAYGQAVDAQAKLGMKQEEVQQKLVQSDQLHRQKLTQNDIAFAQKLRQSTLASKVKSTKA